MLDDLRRKPKKDCLDGFRIDCDAFTRKDIPKVNNFRKPEFTFGELGIERMFTKLEEKEVEMFFMFFVGIGKDRDVVGDRSPRTIQILHENVASDERRWQEH